MNDSTKKENNNGQLYDQSQGTSYVHTVSVLMRPEEEYQNLKREHMDLQMKFLLITNNEKLLQETINNAKILIEEKNQLKEENEKLMEENKILRKKIAELEEKNISLEEQLNYQNKRMSVLEKDIEELKNRDMPITIREGISTLEQYIFMDVLGPDISKEKIKKIQRKIRGAHNLFNDPSYKQECEQFLENNNLTEDHIFLIPDLKKSGNTSAHNRPDILRSEFEANALLTFDDEDEKRMTLELLKYFEITSKPLWLSA